VSIYQDDQGRSVTTNSMLSAFLRCPNQARYKYAERLKPRFISNKDKPLKRGVWFHSLLEEYYAGRDWKAKHKELSTTFSNLFDEEKDALGDLPAEMAKLMRSYLWHYGANKEDPFHGWEVIDTELTLEAEWPDGEGIFRGRIDLLVRDEFGLWIVDHKTHKTFPNASFRSLDTASALYTWAAWENDLPVKGFIWNYIKPKEPTKPKLVYQDTPRERLSNSKIETDYPTYFLALKEYGLDPKEYKVVLNALKNQRWAPDQVQMSPFFRRDILEKNPDQIARVLAASMKTRDKMHGYDYEDTDAVERSHNYTCEHFCKYVNLCMTELEGGNSDHIRRQSFTMGDPLDYYNETEKKKGEE